MTFQEYLKHYGPTIGQLSNMPSEERRFMAKMAYEEWFASTQQEDADEYGMAMEWAGVDFEAGWDLATEMAYMHLAQDARALTEKKGIQK